MQFSQLPPVLQDILMLNDYECEDAICGASDQELLAITGIGKRYLKSIRAVFPFRQELYEFAQTIGDRQALCRMQSATGQINEQGEVEFMGLRYSFMSGIAPADSEADEIDCSSRIAYVWSDSVDENGKCKPFWVDENCEAIPPIGTILELPLNSLPLVWQPSFDVTVVGVVDNVLQGSSESYVMLQRVRRDGFSTHQLDALCKLKSEVTAFVPGFGDVGGVLCAVERQTEVAAIQLSSSISLPGYKEHGESNPTVWVDFSTIRAEDDPVADLYVARVFWQGQSTPFLVDTITSNDFPDLNKLHKLMLPVPSFLIDTISTAVVGSCQSVKFHSQHSNVVDITWKRVEPLLKDREEISDLIGQEVLISTPNGEIEGLLLNCLEQPYELACVSVGAEALDQLHDSEIYIVESNDELDDIVVLHWNKIQPIPFERCDQCSSPYCENQCLFEQDLEQVESVLRTFSTAVRSQSMFALSIPSVEEADDVLQYLKSCYVPKSVRECRIVACGDCNVSDLLLLILEALPQQILTAALSSVRGIRIWDIEKQGVYSFLPKTNPERRQLINFVLSGQHFLLIVVCASFMKPAALKELQAFNLRSKVPISLVDVAKIPDFEGLTIEISAENLFVIKQIESTPFLLNVELED